MFLPIRPNPLIPTRIAIRRLLPGRGMESIRACFGASRTRGRAESPPAAFCRIIRVVQPAEASDEASLMTLALAVAILAVLALATLAWLKRSRAPAATIAASAQPRTPPDPKREALRWIEALFRLSGDAVVTFAGPDQVILAANESAAAVFGYHPGELHGQRAR